MRAFQEQHQPNYLGQVPEDEQQQGHGVVCLDADKYEGFALVRFYQVNDDHEENQHYHNSQVNHVLPSSKEVGLRETFDGAE